MSTALEQAKKAAAGKDVSLGGGAMSRSSTSPRDGRRAGDLGRPGPSRRGHAPFDDLRGAPVELEQVRGVEVPGGAHLTYRVA
jgi:hypothetical protein